MPLSRRVRKTGKLSMMLHCSLKSMKSMFLCNHKRTSIKTAFLWTFSLVISQKGRFSWIWRRMRIPRGFRIQGIPTLLVFRTLLSRESIARFTWKFHGVSPVWLSPIFRAKSMIKRDRIGDRVCRNSCSGKFWILCTAN